MYSNHSVIDTHFAAVEEKFAKEEHKSYHIHLPWFLAYFIVQVFSSIPYSGSGIKERDVYALMGPMDMKKLIPWAHAVIPTLQSLLQEIQMTVRRSTIAQQCNTDYKAVYYQSLDKQYRPSMPRISSNWAQLQIGNQTINTQYN